MKSLKEQNPIVLALAIIGIIAVLYGGWMVYQQHVATEQTQTFFGAPPQGAAAGLYQPSKQPPPQ